MDRSRRAWMTLAVLVVGFLLLFATMDLELSVFDEGLILVDAMRARAGELVHRDYYANYGPAQSYAAAALFSLSHAHFLIVRLYAVLVMSTVPALVFGLLSRHVRAWLALTGAGVVMIWMMSVTLYLYPSLPCLALALFGAVLLVRPGAAQRPWPLIAAGALAGVAALFRYDTGFFILAADGAALAILALADGRAKPWRRAVIACLCCGLGAALVFVPPAIAFLSVAPAAGFYGDVIGYALHYYAAARALPFPGISDRPDNLGVYLPMLAVPCALPFAITDLRRVRAARGGVVTMPATLILTALTAIMIYKGVVRPVPIHMMMAIVPATALVLLCAGRMLGGNRAGAASGIALVMLGVVPAILALLAIVYVRYADRMAISLLLDGRLLADPIRRGGECLAGRSLRGAVIPHDYARAGRFINQNTMPGERIFVGLDRHDRIFVNAVSLYFVADRLPATHWAQFDTDLQSREDIQRLMLAEFARAAPRLVVRDASFTGDSKANDSVRSSGVRLLDHFLDSRYRPVARAGKVAIWLRSDVPTPRLDQGTPACRMDGPEDA